MKKNAIVIFGVGLAIFCLAGCATMVASAVKKGPANNRLFIHDDPQVGDFAMYVTSNEYSNTMTTMKITAIVNDTLAIDWLETNTKLKPIHIEYITDMDGNVIQAFYIDGKGVKSEMPIATPNDRNYVDLDFDILERVIIKDTDKGVQYECYKFDHSISLLGSSVMDTEFLDVTRKSKFLKIYGERVAVLSQGKTYTYRTNLIAQGNEL